MHFLFINANLSGHINPTLVLVKKLTEKGHYIDYFCSEAFSEKVVAAGAKWIGYGNNIENFLKDYHPSDRHPFFMLMEYMLLYDEHALLDVLPLLETTTYDAVICDSYFGGCCFLKRLIDIPVICSHSSFAMSKTPVPARMLVPGFHPQLDFCHKILERICTKYEIERITLEQVFISKGDLNIVYTTRHFNGDESICPPDYLFAGPSLDRLQKPSSLDSSVAKSNKNIYISLGSFNTDYPDFYRLCIETFKNTDYQVFMSIGKKCNITELGEIPSNFTIDTFLPQLEILRFASLFITHAGFNSVNESIYFAVPMLALPLVNDQHMVAKRLTELNLGITSEMRELTSETLYAKAEMLINNEDIKNSCVSISQEMRDSSLERVIEDITRYILS